jgi:hypothetical protein
MAKANPQRRPVEGSGSADRLNDMGRQLERAREQENPGPRSVPEASSDEHVAAHLHRHNFGTHAGFVVFGKITYSLPYAHWYRVQLDDANGDFPCCQITDTAALPFSVKHNSPLPPGSSVLVFKPADGFYGFILGVVPDIVTDGSLVHPDWIVQGGNGGFKRETYYHGLLNQFAAQASVLDFNNSRPVDSSALGEWGKFNDLGGGFHMDPFMLFMRIDENCGLFLNYLDSHARLEGHNLDIRTSFSEEVFRNDNNEGTYYKGSTPYFWEALGCYNQGNPAYRETSNEDVQYKSPRGKLEPMYSDQQPFYRSEEYGGYLGQGFLRQVSLPSNQVNTVERNQFNFMTPNLGVFREQVGLDGSYGLQSAHSITLAKRIYIPVPKRRRQPEDPQGDIGDGLPGEVANYQFAGKEASGVGETKPHKIGDIVDPGNDRPSMTPSVAFDDFMAHLFNWKPLHPFYYHENDFFLPDVQDGFTPPLSGQQNSTPLFSLLLTQMYLDPAKSETLRVDHRHNATYYVSESAFSLLPDGNFVLRGGGGVEIRSLDGNLQISAPGDIIMQSGRSTVSYSGDDIVLKANKSVDVTANENDVRLKAERNVGIMGGNSGRGRVLIESKATGFLHDYERKVGEDIDGSGVILKAADSQIVQLGAEIYMRTGGGDVAGGPIVIDADQGQQDIRMVARTCLRHLELSAADYFPVKGGKTVANVYSSATAQMGTGAQFDGGLAITKNGLQLRGNISVVEGHIGTEQSERYNGLVGVLKDQSLRLATSNLDQVISGMADSREGGKKDYEDAVDQRYYQSDQIGSDDVIGNISFSFRNEEQYNTSNWELVESYWQQMARTSNQQLTMWEDNTIEYQGNTTLAAHPGYDRWQDGCFVTSDLSLKDHEQGIEAKVKSGDYEEASYKWQLKLPLERNYPVIS